MNLISLDGLRGLGKGACGRSNLDKVFKEQ